MNTPFFTWISVVRQAFYFRSSLEYTYHFNQLPQYQKYPQKQISSKHCNKPQAYQVSQNMEISKTPQSLMRCKRRALYTCISRTNTHSDKHTDKQNYSIVLLPDSVSNKSSLSKKAERCLAPPQLAKHTGKKSTIFKKKKAVVKITRGVLHKRPRYVRYLRHRSILKTNNHHRSRQQLKSSSQNNSNPNKMTRSRKIRPSKDGEEQMVEVLKQHYYRKTSEEYFRKLSQEISTDLNDKKSRKISWGNETCVRLFEEGERPAHFVKETRMPIKDPV